MAVLVGLRLSDEDTKRIYDWFLKCGKDEYPLLQPIHPDHLCIPLAHQGSTRMDDFKPLGKMDQVIQFDNRQIQRLGERHSIVMAFRDDWVLNRMEELCKIGFPNRHKKPKCRLPMSIHSTFLNAGGWMKMIPCKQVRVVEEFIIPFDQRFGTYAHLPKDQGLVDQ